MEPLGVVVFSVVMITSFSQILVESIQRLADRSISFIDLPYLAIAAMVTTVVVKAIVWLTYRSFESTSIRGKPGLLSQSRFKIDRNDLSVALAQDAENDVVFNIFSLLFPVSVC